MLATIYSFIKKHSRNENGFTLLEMAIVSLVLGILTVAMRPFIELNIRAYQHTKAIKYAIQHARIGVNRMTAEIKKVASTADINTFNSTEFDFDNTDGERIEFTYGEFSYESFNGLCVMFREVGWISLFNPTQPVPLIHDVSNFSFTYHDQNGNIATNNNEIYSIRIYVELEYEGQTYSVMNQVTPKNLH